MATLQFDSNDLDFIAHELESYDIEATPENIDKAVKHMQQSLASYYYMEQEVRWMAENEVYENA